MKNKPADANWNIQLDCQCPKCNEYVDLTDHSDFLDGRTYLSCLKSSKLEVVCPLCNHEFEVKCHF